MPAEKLSMKKVKELLRLHYENGLSYRELSRSLEMGLGSVSHYLRRAKEAQIAWPLPEGLTDEELRNRLFSKNVISTEKPLIKKPLDFKEIHEELKRKGVTLLLLWYEYREANPQGYSYSRYCYLYQKYSACLKPGMRITHHAGDKVFVDYSGLTVSWIEKETGVIHQAEVFVAVLGASNYTYVEVCKSQNLECWIKAHCYNDPNNLDQKKVKI